ncbi:uncharacterized protein LOC117107161 [Anneissia japonica]|uniref:uncharacterized protein LOC117107161 n=1 Tax=Anneissia japonica TaxID=1529436 RepID=UPI00142556D5|nr:uncharacterized protein LOC117107161 [Anneissia japonica]
MVKEMAVLKVCFYFLLIIPLAGADVPPCANTEGEAVYRGRNRWTLPDPLLAYNNTDMHICSVFCRKNTQCKSFAFADGTCSLYTIQVAKNTRRLVRDESSVHFDSLPIPNRSPGKSYFGACSNGSLCQHGSICENDCTDRGYSCVCAKGFRGINCEHGILDKLSLKATISVENPGVIGHFHFNGNVYIVVSREGGSSMGTLMFRYNVETATPEEIQFIAQDLIYRNTVFTKGEDIYVSMGLKYSESEQIKTYKFNGDTEQLEELIDKVCGRCTAAFLLDSRGDASWFNARYKNPDRATDSRVYSFTGTHFDVQYTQDILTKGVDCSHMFEMDGYNVLVAGNTKSDNGNLINTKIYLQPHDYGRPKTASVFAIFILTDGKLSFLFSSDVSL